MKELFSVRSAIVVVGAILLSACVNTRFAEPPQHPPANDLDSTIENYINDKSTWVDPVRSFRRMYPNPAR